MVTRSLSLFLSLLAMCLLALACSLGWRAVGGGPTAALATPSETAVEQPVAQGRCNELDDQLTTCSEALARVWRPVTPPHYPAKIRALLEIRKRFELTDEAGRACRGAPGAQVSGAALESCLAHTACDRFATCVADNLDAF